jgi:hypothetical protein
MTRNPIDPRLDELLERLDRVIPLDRGAWVCDCPACHRIGSLTVVRGRRRALVLACDDGCPTNAILRAVGMTRDALRPDVLPVTLFATLRRFKAPLTHRNTRGLPRTLPGTRTRHRGGD